MRRHCLHLHLCLIALAIAGCNENEGASTAEETADSVKEKVAEATGDEGAADGEADKPNACALLTDAIVRDHFGLAADVEVKQSEFDVAHHSCTYKWEKPNADEIRAEIEKKQKKAVGDMMRNMRKGKKVQGLVDMATDMPSVDNQLTLTRVDFEMDTPQDAKDKFDGIVRTLNKGIKQRVKTKAVDEEVEFKSKTEPVEGVGDKAAWSARMSQLSVVSGTDIFHLVVKLHQEPEKNLEAAKKLAGRLVDEL